VSLIRCNIIFSACLLSPLAAAPDLKPLLEEYCIDCHDGDVTRGGLNLDAIMTDALEAHPEIWEKVIMRLQSRQMPPPSKKNRPTEKEYVTSATELSAWFDQLSHDKPNPGRTDTIRRLTRFEYRNSIRDLLALDLDVNELLPQDESSQGFDNITLGTLSPTLLNRYVQAAQKISRLAVGIAPVTPAGRIIRLPADLSQENHVVGLPPGTRGGTRFEHPFPVAGEYEIEIRLTRNRDEFIEGLNGAHELDILLNDAPLQRFTVKPNGNGNQEADAHLKTRFQAPAGPTSLGVTFVEKSPTLVETKRLPYDTNYNMHRHPRRTPAIYQISITGPFTTSPSKQETPSRKLIFHRLPANPDDEEPCATEIFSRIIERAYRRPATAEDLINPLTFFREARKKGNFETAVEAGLSSILASPRFFLRIENDPAGAAPDSVYALDGYALASRLSYFLWSSLPDQELLDLAKSGKLTQPDVLEAQARRLLADPRSNAFITNFAGQWLHLRNLDSFHPDLRLFPDFDDNLRQSLRRETELFFQSLVQENRSALDLLNADFTFLNERLAKHYEIPGIRGSHFRRVTLTPDTHRGGLLRHGSILAVTSYAHRTSPVIRGNWILGNILGTPTPPPPPDIPSLDDTVVSGKLPMRERLAAHRADRSCATCHDLMDPVGFAMENFDATGRWRTLDDERLVNALGGLPDGQILDGPDQLKTGLLARPELLVRAITGKMLTYSLGRGIGPHDQPAIRTIIRDTAKNQYRLTDIVVGIVRSVPFTHRKTQP
jgi:hypothetical protein